MAFIPTDETVRTTLNFVGGDGGEAVNVIYVKTREVPVTSTTLATINGIIFAWASAAWDDFASSVWTLASVESVDQTTEDGIYHVLPVGVPGALASNALPAMNTIAVQLLTGRIGRSNRGRLYHVGTAEEMVAGNYMLPLAADGLVNAYDSLKNDFDAADLDWSVVSYRENGVARVAGRPRPVTQIALADLKIDRQIRRMFHGS